MQIFWFPHAKVRKITIPNKNGMVKKVKLRDKTGIFLRFMLQECIVMRIFALDLIHIITN